VDAAHLEQVRELLIVGELEHRFEVIEGHDCGGLSGVARIVINACEPEKCTDAIRAWVAIGCHVLSAFRVPHGFLQYMTTFHTLRMSDPTLRKSLAPRIVRLSNLPYEVV